MRKIIFIALASFVLTGMTSVIAHSKATSNTVLIVVSGAGQDAGKTLPGFEMDELSQAWLIFNDNGLKTVIASPRGGQVEADKFDAELAFNARFISDPRGQAQLSHTLAFAEIRPEQYDALYVVGGKGAMFDLVQSQELSAITRGIYDLGGIISALCHGPAVLANVTLNDGTSLIANRRVTGFSNEEEAIFGKKWQSEFPFLIETKLKALGARWEESPMMMPKVVEDGQLITGQNPYSTAQLAEAIVRKLGRTPIARKLHRDENAMVLAEWVHRGQIKQAVAQLAAAPKKYHVELIGLLGYYQLQSANTKDQVLRAQQLMELVRPYFAPPELLLGLAQSHQRLGNLSKARELAQALLAINPKLDAAKKLMAQIEQTQ